MNLIVDGSNLLHRCFWINSKSKAPLVLGEVFIFLRTIKSYIKKFEAEKCFVCWDKKLLFPSTNFRKEMQNVEYKGNRDNTINIYENEDLLAEFLTSLGIQNMFPRIMEADDVMAWLSLQLEGPNLIITSDADLLQMVSERTNYFHPQKKEIVTLDNFENYATVKKNEYLYYKCILGDVSDNIIGWKGYGPVKARKAAKEITENVNKLFEYSNDQIEIFKRNNKLINLEQGWYNAGPEEEEAYKAQLCPIESDIDKFKELCEKHNFNDFVKKIDEWKELFSRDMLTF